LIPKLIYDSLIIPTNKIISATYGFGVTMEGGKIVLSSKTESQNTPSQNEVFRLKVLLSICKIFTLFNDYSKNLPFLNNTEVKQQKNFFASKFDRLVKNTFRQVSV